MRRRLASRRHPSLSRGELPGAEQENRKREELLHLFIRWGLRYGGCFWVARRARRLLGGLSFAGIHVAATVFGSSRAFGRAVQEPATQKPVSRLVSFPSLRENILGWAEEVSGRPVVAEARRQVESLFGRSAPRPLLRRRGRISGPAEAGSLHSQARREKAQGRGAEASAYRRRLS
jgi:hypothetical protein